MKFVVSKEIKKHKENKKPILALESTIIAHGMPYPANYVFAKKTEKTCREKGVAPAFIAIIDGEIHIGLNDKKLKFICQSKNVLKTAKRDLSFVIAKKQNGATTVSATAWIAYKAGIFVFATGGIGGVHRGAEISFDVSQDLKSLSETPIIVISAGAKSILDLPKTVETLETYGVPILGYKTSSFPAFYTRDSKIKIKKNVKTQKEIFSIFTEHQKLGLRSSVLVVNPIPKKNEIPSNKINSFISDAICEAKKKHILGKELTPFLLKKIVEKTGGDSLKANVSLALNNVKLGVKIAKKVAPYNRTRLGDSSE